MKLLADEGVDKQIVERLRRDGHDVSYVAESAKALADADVLQLAKAESRVLLTQDKDFGELVFRQELVTHGVFLVRLAGVSSDDKAILVAKALNDYGPQLTAAFAVLSPSALRIRRIGTASELD